MRRAGALSKGVKKPPVKAPPKAPAKKAPTKAPAKKAPTKAGDAAAALGAAEGAAAGDVVGEEPTGFSPGGGGVAGAPCKPDSGTKINIQISGADMSASSGVFSEVVGGPEEEAGGGGFGGLLGGGAKAPAKAPAKKKDAKAPAKKKDAKAPAKKATKAPARKSKFTLEGAPVVTGDDIAWAFVGFLLVALLILI
jgi:hypothetical protein